MKPRKIRMTDAEWEDAKFIGPQEVRELIVKRAKKLRAIDKAKDPLSQQKEMDGHGN